MSAQLRPPDRGMVLTIIMARCLMLVIDISIVLSGLARFAAHHPLRRNAAGARPERRYKAAAQTA